MDNITAGNNAAKKNLVSRGTAPVLFGIDQLLARSSAFNKKRIALVCNQASVTTNGIAGRIALLKAGFSVVKLFSPEHGLDAAGADGHYQSNGIDAVTGLPVISLYGETLSPLPKDLDNIDCVVFDIPDVGCRFYTYLWTMTHVMEACAHCNVPLIIADRPNPIGCDLSLTEGPLLNETTSSSFIGRWSIPVRHSCTLGELALYFKATRMPNLQLEVIPVANISRDQRSGYDFTPTSPAIQKRATALLYPGMGLLEGINVNEGRGTSMPFEVCAAPWIDKNELPDFVKAIRNPGVDILPASYTAVAGLYKGEQCHGIRLTVTDEALFRPVSTGISLVHALLSIYPEKVEERLYDTHANPGGSAHLDKLLGIPNALNTIRQHGNLQTSVAAPWKAVMEDHLLYK